MIELTVEDPNTLKTTEELFEALAGLVGRTLMVSYSGGRSSYNYPATRPARVAGELRWLKLEDRGSSIILDMGRPLVGDYPKMSSVSLKNRISVLTDGVWTVVHQPLERKEEIKR